MSSRLERERQTVSAMIRLYCGAHHRPGRTPCPDCARLEQYARSRIDRCPFGADKPVCALCPIHCYRQQEREGIRAVMRWAGPRMLLHHPLLALAHLLDRGRGPSPRRESRL